MTSKCQWVGFKRRCLPTSCRDCKDTSIDSLHHFLFILHCKNICNFHGITKFVSKELSSTKAKGNFYIFKTKREFSMWSLFLQNLEMVANRSKLELGLPSKCSCSLPQIFLHSLQTQNVAHQNVSNNKTMSSEMLPTRMACPPPLSPPPRIGSPGKVHVSLFQAPVGKGSKTKSLR